MPDKKIVCLVCGGRVLFHRCDDQDMYVPISEDGEVLKNDVIEGKSNGYSEWTCEKDASHDVN